jgi:hypothetical protein
LGKSLISWREAKEWGNEGETYNEILVTANGWEWIKQNEDKFMLRRPKPEDLLDDPAF